MIPLHFFAEIINSSFGQSWLAADVCENCTQSVPSKQPATANQTTNNQMAARGKEQETDK